MAWRASRFRESFCDYDGTGYSMALTNTASVAIGSLGAIGSKVAAELSSREPHLKLAAVSARDQGKARDRLAALGLDVPVVEAADLADAADIVVECAPAALFRTIAEPAIEKGRTLIVATVGQLLFQRDLVERAQDTGARIIAITGAIAGLDAIRAASLGGIESATLVTRKAPGGLAGAPYLVERDFQPDSVTEPTRVFRGNTFEAAEAFPANVNVGAALALAGCGPDLTTVEVWADPGAVRTSHRITVRAAAMNLDISLEVLPSPDNPKSSTLTPLSILTALDGLINPVRIGS